MSTSVTTMKTANTASSVNTISDCARETSADPTIEIAAIATTTSVVKTLSQAPPASSPTKSEVA